MSAYTEESVILAYQAGYARGHDDTVEGCYNGSIEHEPDAALEWMYGEELAKGAAQ